MLTVLNKITIITQASKPIQRLFFVSFTLKICVFFNRADIGVVCVVLICRQYSAKINENRSRVFVCSYQCFHAYY